MYWLILIFSIFPLLAFFVSGIFLIYSAVTGKGMTPPGPDARLALIIRYKFRGVFGIVFTLVSAFGIWRLVTLGLEDLM